MKEQMLQIANKLRSGEISDKEARKQFLFLFDVMPMFADDSNEGNIKRVKLIEDYKRQIPDWQGSYGQGFADAFNWLCRAFKANWA